MFDTKQIKEEIKNHQQEFLADLKEVIQVQSVVGEAQTGRPFGAGPREVLDVIVGLGKKYGFKTGIVNDAMAYVEWGPATETDNYVGIVGHLDVVAAGDGWSFPPFDLSEAEGYLYGRGVLDNKGPSMACLYGMKLLKDLGVQPQKKIRLIFGSNEESGSNDVPLYLKNEQAPEFGFTPDCKFPVVYGERGIISYEITTPINAAEFAQLESITGNQAPDHVPDEVQAVIAGQKIEIKGKRSPTNAPERGQNALTYLAQKVVTEKLVEGQLLQYFEWLYQSFHEKHYGEGLNMAFSDQESGKLIQTPYMLRKEDGCMVLDVAIRYPVSVTEQQVTTGIKAAVLPTSEIKVIRNFPSVLHAKDDQRIDKLSQIYEQVTGLDGTPVTTTGATYARVMPNIVAFGPSFPGQKGIAHKQDEWMKLTDLLTMMEIYMRSIYALTKEG